MTRLDILLFALSALSSFLTFPPTFISLLIYILQKQSIDCIAEELHTM
jgi:hypothetical protein